MIMGGWLIALPFLVALRVINKRFKGKGQAKTAVSVVTMSVAFIAGCGLAFTFAGEWFAAALSFGARVAGKVSPDLGAAIPIAATVLAVLVAVADLAYDRKADRGAQIAAVLMPTLLALVVGGSMGATGGEAVRTVNSSVTSFMSQLGGA